MFCPKCGTKNPEDGKFCRKCGTELAEVANALTGGSSNYLSAKSKKRKSKISWESAFGKLFSGLAFLVVAIILGITGAAGAEHWWFWMLIPAFGMLGAGAAQIVQLRSSIPGSVDVEDPIKEMRMPSEKSLPAPQTEYISPETGAKYETGELVPPSVVENTTRHLKIDKEGKTMTLPKQD